MKFFQRIFCKDIEKKLQAEYDRITNTIEVLHQMYGTEKGKLSNLQIRIATYLHSKYKMFEEIKLDAKKLNISETAFRNLIQDLETNGIIKVIEKTVKNNMVTKKIIWSYKIELKELEDKIKLMTEKEKEELKLITDKIEKVVESKTE